MKSLTKEQFLNTKAATLADWIDNDRIDAELVFRILVAEGMEDKAKDVHRFMMFIRELKLTGF